MSEQLGPVELKLRSLDEQLTLHGQETGLTLAAFWAWNGSDLLNNALRGKLAEYIVARAIGASGEVRVEWDPYDLTAPYGARIEVKSGAYIQSWHQERYSSISFGVSRQLAWNSTTNQLGSEQVRSADVYVFCVLHHRDQDTVNPLDLDQWTFYVAATSLLDDMLGSQKTVSLSTLLRIGVTGCEFGRLSDFIHDAYETHRA